MTCGDFFGEENLMGNTEYDNYAIIKRDPIILTISIDDFNYYLSNKIYLIKILEIYYFLIKVIYSDMNH